MKVSELIKALREQEDVFGDYEIFMSQDEEGNGFGSLLKEYMFGWSDEDKVLILYPAENYLQYEDICPKDNLRVKKEIEEMEEDRFENENGETTETEITKRDIEING